MKNVLRWSVTGVAAVTCWALLSPISSPAVDVYTDPVGFITLTVKGTNGTPPGTTSVISFLGLSMTQLVVSQGRVTSFSANSVTDSNALWTADQFNGANGAHFIEITSGPYAGTIDDIVDTDDATKTITTLNDLSSLLSGAETYRIRRHWTLAAIFGPNNEAGLQGGTSGATADIVSIANALGGFDTYYYKDVNFPPGTGVGWRKTDNVAVDASGTTLYIDEGLILRRRQGTDITVKLVGAVKLGETMIPIENGNNFRANVYASSLTLATSGLYTGDASTGMAGGSSAAAADNLLISNGLGFDTYYYKTVNFPPGTGTGWRRTDNVATDMSSTPLPIGSSVVIQRKGAAFDWASSAPY